jgi:hypothetical protein
MAKPGKRLSKRELHDLLHGDEKKPEKRDRKNPILGLDGKPLNTRKVDGARKTIIEQTIVSKLYQDGFLVAWGGEVSVDATKRIEKSYGEESGVNIRRILYKLVIGFHMMGANITVNGYRWGATEDGPEADRDYRPEDWVFGDIRSALHSGVCVDGWKGHSIEARGDVSSSGDSGSEERG